MPSVPLIVSFMDYSLGPLGIDESELRLKL